MLKEKIITCEGGKQYYVINELNLANRLFVLGAEVNLANDSIDTDNLVVREIVTNGNDVNVLSLKNDEELANISKALISKASFEA